VRTLGLAVIDNPDITEDELCSALGVFGTPRDHALHEFQDPRFGAAWIGVGEVGPFRLVAHHHLPEFVRAWEGLSYGGRVLVFRLSDSFQSNTWALYESGRKIRYADEASGSESGAPHLLERGLHPDMPPAEEIAALFGAMTGRKLLSDAVLSMTMRAWSAA